MDDIKNIRSILRFVYNNHYSDFYRKKYQNSAVNPLKIRTISDFKKLPFLERNELLETEPLKRIFISENKLSGASTTSGTSKKGSLIILRKKEDIEQYYFKELKKAGIKKLMFLVSANTVNRYVNDTLPSDLFTVFVDFSNLILAAELAAGAKIEALYTSPTPLYFFIPYLAERYDLNKIRDIHLSGEFCSLTQFKILKSFFPKAVFRFNYGSAEVQMVGWQCRNLVNANPSVFHFSRFIYPEVINPQTLSDIKQDRTGELVLTALSKKAFVAIRYKTGDVIKILTKQCRCKNKKPLFEILGKAGTDYISVAGTRLVKNEFERVLSTDKKVSLDFKVYIYEKSTNSKLVYYVEAHLLPKNRKLLGNSAFAVKLAKKLQTNLKVSPTLTFEDLVEKGIFSPLKVVLVEKLPLETKRKSFEMIADKPNST
ncbi:MAG: hypothetical protein Q8P25_00815 [Candidatus Curtissbacteria bacterium]|nr:hypothetical protein [Candidatus Curtissbacteria bacterium]